MIANSQLPLVLIGAGGLARELLGWMSMDDSWDRPIAMVQDNAAESQFGVDVVSFEDFQGPARFLVAVGSPDLKEKMVKKALNRGWLPETYIDKSSILGLNVKIGSGCLVSPFSTISTNVVVGDYVTLNCRSSIGHESTVGDYSTLLGSNQVNGNVKVGDRVTLGAGCIIHPGKSIGSRATVGIGSVVLTNVKQQTVVFGSPAKRISHIDND